MFGPWSKWSFRVFDIYKWCPSKVPLLQQSLCRYLLYWIVEKQYHRSSGASKSNKNTCNKCQKSTNPNSFMIHVVLLTFVSLVTKIMYLIIKKCKKVLIQKLIVTLPRSQGFFTCVMFAVLGFQSQK